MDRVSCSVHFAPINIINMRRRNTMLVFYFLHIDTRVFVSRRTLLLPQERGVLASQNQLTPLRSWQVTKGGFSCKMKLVNPLLTLMYQFIWLFWKKCSGQMQCDNWFFYKDCTFSVSVTSLWPLMSVYWSVGWLIGWFHIRGGGKLLFHALDNP